MSESIRSYDADFHAWAIQQAAALRARDYEALDWKHLAEELEGMAAGERREIKARLIALLMHLLKLAFQPGEVWRHPYGPQGLLHGWRSIVIEARRQILLILDDSPGVFQGKRDEVLARTYQAARKDATRQSRLPLSTFPEVCPWTYEQIMDEEFFPEKVAHRDRNVALAAF
jgi:hypothetical protein